MVGPYKIIRYSCCISRGSHRRDQEIFQTIEVEHIAREALTLVDPTDTEKIRALQTDIKVCNWAIGYLVQKIKQSNQLLEIKQEQFKGESENG